MNVTAVEPSGDKFPGKVQLCQGEKIQYKAYARTFNGTPPVLYLVATCAYPVGPYDIFFEPEPGPGWKWKLMERAPNIFYDLVTYHIASTTSGQPPAQLPKTVDVTDYFGTHTVSIVPWS